MAFLQTKEWQADAVLVSDPFNIRHITGFAGGEGYLYVSGEGKVLLVDSRYTVQAKKETDGITVTEYRNNYMEELALLVKAQGIKSLGFEGEALSYQEYEKLSNFFPEVTLVSIGDYFTRKRAVKTETELSLLERAEAIGDEAFSRILGILKPGMTELSVAAHLEFFMKEAGAEGLSFDTIVASGIHSSMPHAVPTGKKLEKGDFVTMDFGCRYHGYCSDMTRTVVIGKAGQKQKEIYQVVLEAQLAALDFIRAGKRGNEVDAVARKLITKAGFGEYFGHGLGHGVGLFIHEEPRLSRLCEEELFEGMIETVEPGIYIPGFGGVRIEDMVAVTRNGCKNFTKSTKELLEL